MALYLVPPALPPDRKTTLVERIKEMPRPDGMLQCSRCGGRDTMTIRSGDMVVDGRIKPGKVIEQGICPHCYKRGVIVDLIPPKPKIVKEPKPRRPKLKEAK
ncbi:hypothetical protein [Comamonas kerstersii]|uniref:Uncharacterized protein n=1 Tax=Comamonas kerstersii TaxID=225992 RepID=A0A6A1R1S8_9BURK|nr:hypothetical protein [Comamonas kerstersii]KAB0586175.1 hypothetical protein F7P80_11110 [Comamonas kerstersii]